MKLFELHDDARGLLDWEERTWLAVWAHDAQEAARLYADAYTRRTDADAPPASEDIRCEEALPLPEGATPPAAPGVEDDARVHRRMGWRIEGERSCDTCGLAPMDLPQYRVCDECGQCPECWHAEDCEEGLAEKGVGHVAE